MIFFWSTRLSLFSIKSSLRSFSEPRRLRPTIFSNTRFVVMIDWKCRRRERAPLFDELYKDEDFC